MSLTAGLQYRVNQERIAAAQRLARTAANNVYRKSLQPFVPPSTPQIGPNFTNLAFQERLASDLLLPGSIVLYRGPAGTGKSTQLGRVLREQAGVTRISLKGVRDVPQEFGAAAGMFGDRISREGAVLLLHLASS